MKTVLWLVGEPGTGKTTLARRLLEPDMTLVERPKWTVGSFVCAAGHYTGMPFDGADTVPYAGAQQALEFWRERLGARQLTILDGDRFSNAGVVEFFRALPVPYRLVCAHLGTDPAVAAQRRADRGSAQQASWVLGRKTKSHRFATGLFGGEDLLMLDGSANLDALVQQIEDALNKP